MYWSEMTGFSQKESLGDGWHRAVHPDDRERVIDEWKRTVEHTQPFQHEVRFQHDNGAIKWVYFQAIAEHSPDGDIIGYVGAIIDMSDRPSR